jgi:ABC-type Fe3+ transport system substrate-binding protein
MYKPVKLGMIKNAPHPNATKVYINWLLSKNAATMWRTATGYPSRRLDVSKEGLDPKFIPKGDEIELEESFRQETQKIAAEIFKEYLR